MSENYEQLLERSIRAQEQANGLFTRSNDISQSLLEVSKGLKSNVKELNDKFILHQNEMKDVYKDVKLVRDHLLKWIKYLAIIVFVIVGGFSILRITGVDVSQFLK